MNSTNERRRSGYGLSQWETTFWVWAKPMREDVTMTPRQFVQLLTQANNNENHRCSVLLAFVRPVQKASNAKRVSMSWHRRGKWKLYHLLQTEWSLQWRHNEHDSVSNHQPHDCLLNHLFRGRSKKTSKLRVTGLCAGNSPVTGEFPAQRASNAENVSIWWRHHVFEIGMLVVTGYTIL